MLELSGFGEGPGGQGVDGGGEGEGGSLSCAKDLSFRL